MCLNIENLNKKRVGKRKVLKCVADYCVLHKSYLTFSSLSQFSIDIRNNLFGHSKSFASLWGAKMDWDLPSKVVQNTKKGKIQRRDLYQGMEHFLRRQDLNETSCIRRFLCEASVILPKSNHFLAQLYEVIFSVHDRDIKNAYKIGDSEEQCAEMFKQRTEIECPLSLTSVLPGSEPNVNVFIN